MINLMVCFSPEFCIILASLDSKYCRTVSRNLDSARPSNWPTAEASSAASTIVTPECQIFIVYNSEVLSCRWSDVYNPQQLMEYTELLLVYLLEPGSTDGNSRSMFPLYRFSPVLCIHAAADHML